MKYFVKITLTISIVVCNLYCFLGCTWGSNYYRQRSSSYPLSASSQPYKGSTKYTNTSPYNRSSSTYKSTTSPYSYSQRSNATNGYYHNNQNATAAATQARRTQELKNFYDRVENILNHGCSNREECLRVIRNELQTHMNTSDQSHMTMYSSFQQKLNTLAEQKIFYTPLVIQEQMSPNGWEEFKKGTRVNLMYLKDIARLKSVPHHQNIDIQKDDLLNVILQEAIIKNKQCTQRSVCFNNDKMLIQSYILEVQRLNLPSSESIAFTLTTLINKMEAAEITEKPVEFLEIIKAEYNSALNAQQNQNIIPQKGLEEYQTSLLGRRQFDSFLSGTSHKNQPYHQQTFISKGNKPENQTKKKLKDFKMNVQDKALNTLGRFLDKIFNRLES